MVKIPALRELVSLLNVDDRFLGPRMVYTSGIVSDLQTEESLEQLQDNKMTVVCEKVRIYEVCVPPS